MRLITVPFLLVLLLLKGLLWVLFVPLGRGLLRIADGLGPLRLPFIILFSPIIIPCALLDAGDGRMLEGDLIRPTFNLPYTFVRGPWTALEEQGVLSAELEWVEGERRSTLSISVSDTLANIRSTDEMAARMIDKALQEPAPENGMRWAGVRVRTGLHSDAPLTCLYVVWKDDEPHNSCINVRFTGPAEHEQAADDFVSSVMPQCPEQAPLRAAPEA